MPTPTAEMIGLEGFSTSFSGIGGRIKSRVSDFRVEEISTNLALNNKGRFTLARITLTNWETNRFINRLAKTLHIPRKRIFFAGTKDKRAITKQLFVIDAPMHKVSQVELKDVEIEVLGRTNQKIGFGNHKGNRFTIIVRGCAHPDGSPMTVEEATSEVENIRNELARKMGENTFPNWIGPQRFGSGRPVTAEVGRHVVEGDWERAVMTYLAMEGEHEADEAAEVRRKIRENGISDDLLDGIPNWMGFEKTMINHLLSKPEDYLGAFKTLPNNLQLMTVHALQSVVFNKSLQSRISSGIPLSTPVSGDLVAHLQNNGQMDSKEFFIVEERTMPRISRNCKMKRLCVTGPLPGSDISTSEGESGKLETLVIKDMGLENANWRIEDIPRLSTRGTRRPLVAEFDEFSYESVTIASAESLGDSWIEGPKEGDRWHPEGACIKFRFTLSSGTYATTLLREFMQSPINHMG